jgi:hypothetical protein
MNQELDRMDDEIEAVLAALRKLMSRVRRPIVRACLQEAHDDIAHLAERHIEESDGLLPSDVA